MPLSLRLMKYTYEEKEFECCGCISTSALAEICEINMSAVYHRVPHIDMFPVYGTSNVVALTAKTLNTVIRASKSREAYSIGERVYAKRVPNVDLELLIKLMHPNNKSKLATLEPFQPIEFDDHD